MVKKIMIGTPVYGGMCNINYSNSLMQVPGVLHTYGLELMYYYITNDALITRARNQIVKAFLDSDATHLLFIDSDIGFNPKDIVTMSTIDKDIMCGIYPKKGINWVSVADAVKQNVEPQYLQNFTGDFVGIVDNPILDENSLLDIEYGGTGFMMIKKEVFLKLMDKVDTYLFDGLTPEQLAINAPIFQLYQYFDTSICDKTKRLLSEDYFFCKLAKENGYTIYGAPWVNLSHTGSYTFKGQVQV